MASTALNAFISLYTQQSKTFHSTQCLDSSQHMTGGLPQEVLQVASAKGVAHNKRGQTRKGAFGPVR